jgi:diaminopimelate epimerase
MPLPFVKLVAAGNAYLAVDGRERERDWPALARAICRHRFGVGSDGLLVAVRSRCAPIGLRIWNSDGSEAEMSGNGVRLFAKFALESGLARAGAEGLLVETRAGLRRVWPQLAGGRMLAGRVAMGVPEVEPGQTTLALGDLALPVTCLSLGNPHAVHLSERSVDEFPLAEIGPRVERHPRFPGRTNFEVVNVLARDRLRVRVFERGEGETLSSGTGSTASVVAARLAGRVGADVAVELRGGVLRVRYEGPGQPAYLEGPTQEVFSGLWQDGVRTGPEFRFQDFQIRPSGKNPNIREFKLRPR